MLTGFGNLLENLLPLGSGPTMNGIKHNVCNTKPNNSLADVNRSVKYGKGHN